MMEVKDFTPVKAFDYYGKAPIWGETVGIGVDCGDTSLEAMLPKLNDLISFLDGSKEKVVSALVEKNYLSYGEYWTSEAEGSRHSEDKWHCYIMEDGTEVSFPLTEQSFYDSLHFDGITICLDSKRNDITAIVYLVCKPDYFDHHCIRLAVNSTGSIEVKDPESRSQRSYIFENEANLTRDFNAIYHRHVKKRLRQYKIPRSR